LGTTALDCNGFFFLFRRFCVLLFSSCCLFAAAIIQSASSFSSSCFLRNSNFHIFSEIFSAPKCGRCSVVFRSCYCLVCIRDPIDSTFSRVVLLSLQAIVTKTTVTSGLLESTAASNQEGGPATRKGGTQGRNEARWRPGQEASLAPPCSNLRFFGSKCTVLKKVLVTILGRFGDPRNHSAPGELFSPCPLVTPWGTTGQLSPFSKITSITRRSIFNGCVVDIMFFHNHQKSQCWDFSARGELCPP